MTLVYLLERSTNAEDFLIILIMLEKLNLLNNKIFNKLIDIIK